MATEKTSEQAMSCRSNQMPKKNQPHRQLNSFRRQLVAAFSSERPLRFSSSNESGDVSNNIDHESKWRSCENELDHGSKSNGSKLGWTRSRTRRFNSPKHLIRMFAERHDDSSNDSADEHQHQHQLGIKNNLMSFIVETPTKAANCFKIGLLTKTLSSDINHLGRAARPSTERPRQVAETVATRSFNLPLPSPNSIQLPTGSILPLCRSDNSSSRSPSQTPRVKTVLKKRQPSASDVSKLVDFLDSHDWRSLSDQTIILTENSLFQLKLKLKSFGLNKQDLSAPAESLRLQNEALWELIDTELHYIGRLKLMVDLFLSTLVHVQARLGLLTDISKSQIASNVEQILEANLKLWEKHLNIEPVSGQPSIALTPLTFAEAFENIHHIFKPYYRFCTEQASCARFVRKLALTNDYFRIYLAWCEAQHDCDRMKLTDLLACPMQRLTRYSLLLRTLLKQTPDEQLDQRECLFHMIALTDKFVKSVDLELRRRDDFLRLLRASNRIDLNQLGEDCGADSSQQQQILELLSRHYKRLDLMAPLFDCPSSCQRQLIFDSSVPEFDGKAWTVPLEKLKFKDSQTGIKLDIVLVIFTDQLIVCKQKLSHQHQRLNQISGNSLLRRQSSNYLTSFKRHSMRLSKRHQATQKASSNSNLSGYSFDKSDSPPVTLNEICKDYHSDNNFSTSAEENSNYHTDTDPSPKNDKNNTLSWPVRRRAASHSYLLGTNLLTLAGSGCEFNKPDGQPRGSSFLSPVRAILRVPSQRLLNHSSLDRHQSRSSQQISATVFDKHQRGGSSSYENSSNCSLISSQNNAPFKYHHDAFDDNTMRIMSMREYDLSAQSDNKSAASTHKQAKGDQQQLRTTRLLAIRPPYAIEQLAVHELAGGQSVLFCQLNETRTIINSFVVYCHNRAKHADKLLLSSRSPNQSSSSCPQNYSASVKLEHHHHQQWSGKTSAQNRRANLTDTSKHVTGANYHDDVAALSQARRLILLVKEAQVRHRALTKLHGRALAGTGSAEPSRSYSLYQNSLSLEVPSSPKHSLGYTHFRSNESDLEDFSTSDEQGWRLRLFAEQHQLFLLNHGLQNELVTHEFTYNERRPNDFVVSAKVINPSSNRTTFRWEKTATSSTHREPNRRPQLCRFIRSDSLLRDEPNSINVGSSGKSNLSDHEHLTPQGFIENKSESNGCLDRANGAIDFELDARDIAGPPSSLAANTFHCNLTDDSNPPSPCRGSRRTLNSLRRQNVILSASCEQHQLQDDERESLSAHLLRASRFNESSSIDSVVVTSITYDTSGRSTARGNHQLMRRHESSSLQATTIDQTFDDDERPAGSAAHHHELSPIKSVQSISLHHQPSASSEQTSSPIAFTLTVPSRASLEERRELGADFVQPQSDLQAADSIDEETDERQTGCLDLSKTFCPTGGGGGKKWQDQRKCLKFSARVPGRSRSPVSRLQDMIQCLRPTR